MDEMTKLYLESIRDLTIQALEGNGAGGPIHKLIAIQSLTKDAIEHCFNTRLEKK